VTSEHILRGSVSEEQRSQTAFCAKTLRAARLLAVASVGSSLTARCGDARNSPPWPRPKSAAAGLLLIFKPALQTKEFEFEIYDLRFTRILCERRGWVEARVNL